MKGAGLLDQPGRLPVPPRGSALGELVALLRKASVPPARLRLGLLAAFIVLIVCANTLAQLRLNEWQGAFYDAIEQRNLQDFVHQLMVFAVLFAVLLILVVSQTWLVERAKVELRYWLSSSLVDAWLQPRRAFLLGFAGELGDNPDQRLHEDVRHLSELTGDLAVGLLQSSLLLASFVGVLWILSGPVVPAIAERIFPVPGFLVWCALAYALIGSWLTLRIGGPLVRLNAERYAQEAELRYALMRVGESAQAIALYSGERGERATLRPLLDAVMDRSRKLATALARLTWVTSAYGWGTLVVPILLASPGYFAGTVSLGGLMMVVGAFNQVQQALRWFVDNFPRIADWRATLQRTSAISDALDSLTASVDAAGAGRVLDEASGVLVLDGVRLHFPDKTGVLDPAHVEIRSGERVLVVGPPSCGKTTLVLALAGLWPWWSGYITLPPRDRMMILPQRPYLPLGTLRAAVLYPLSDHAHASETFERIFRDVGLAHRIADLDIVARWDRELSLEEQQLLALARLFLHRPAWVVMDEAMSALDPQQRAAVFGLLDRTLSDAAIIATSRGNGFDPFFTRLVRIATQPPAAAAASSREDA